jgi:hypothetical protein
MRKGFEGLAAWVGSVLHEKVKSGATDLRPSPLADRFHLSASISLCPEEAACRHLQSPNIRDEAYRLATRARTLFPTIPSSRKSSQRQATKRRNLLTPFNSRAERRPSAAGCQTALHPWNVSSQCQGQTSQSASSQRGPLMVGQTAELLSACRRGCQPERRQASGFWTSFRVARADERRNVWTGTG